MALPRSFWRIPVAALALAVMTLTLAAAPSPRQAPTIAISLTGNGVRVSEPRVEVGRNEAVTWTSPVPFAIVVGDQGTLFPGVPAQAMRGLANRPVQARVGGSTPAGPYKYSVVVWDGEELRVLDPEIVVRPD